MFIYTQLYKSIKFMSVSFKKKRKEKKKKKKKKKKRRE